MISQQQRGGVRRSADRRPITTPRSKGPSLAGANVRGKEKEKQFLREPVGEGGVRNGRGASVGGI